MMDDDGGAENPSSGGSFVGTYCGNLGGYNEAFRDSRLIQSGDTMEQDRLPELSFDLPYLPDAPENGHDSVDLTADGWDHSVLTDYHQYAPPLSLQEFKNSFHQGRSTFVLNSDICHSPVELAGSHEGDTSLASLCSAFEEE